MPGSRAVGTPSWHGAIFRMQSPVCVLLSALLGIRTSCFFLGTVRHWDTSSCRIVRWVNPPPPATCMWHRTKHTAAHRTLSPWLSTRVPAPGSPSLPLKGPASRWSGTGSRLALPSLPRWPCAHAAAFTSAAPQTSTASRGPCGRSGSGGPVRASRGLHCVPAKFLLVSYNPG